MIIRKHDGRQEKFDLAKIIKVLQMADHNGQCSQETILMIAEDVAIRAKEIAKLKGEVTADEVQEAVELAIIKEKKHDLARNFMIGCYEKKLVRDERELDKQILEITNNENEEVNTENSNKNPTLVSTQRDYMAGAVSKNITSRLLLPQDVVDAHNQGKIHFHDTDFFALHMHNCDLINLEDMFENGTVISGVKIDTPKSLRTAATIMTQVSALVSASQYGGQTMSLAHLVPYIQKSRDYYEAEYDQETADKLLKREIKDSVQTLQYQTITLATSNGQAPFLTFFMDLGEVKEGREREDFALLIEEVLKQRIKGVKNSAGQWIAPAFPKLIYVLRDYNVDEGTEYYWLTQLAAECTTKRMVPDYISAKVMKELKGDVYSSMGLARQ